MLIIINRSLYVHVHLSCACSLCVCSVGGVRQINAKFGDVHKCQCFFDKYRQDIGIENWDRSF